MTCRPRDCARAARQARADSSGITREPADCRLEDEPVLEKKLYIAEATVETHITHILRKFDLHDRIQAVVLAARQCSSRADVQ
jgi:hypothetical protein